MSFCYVFVEFQDIFGVLNNVFHGLQIGQRHGGFLGVLQRALARASPHIWFERAEAKDRSAVASRSVQEFFKARYLLTFNLLDYDSTYQIQRIHRSLFSLKAHASIIRQSCSSKKAVLKSGVLFIQLLLSKS